MLEPLACPADANRAVVREASAVQHAAPFEVLLLKGELGAPGRGAVHRSPPLESAGQQRVVLVLSSVNGA